ncbi:MAG: SprB repeat-containing protein [Bacteroidetes bacterium]|nr:SprB repeat-containing protein [Bacteroidota bacterium]
MRKILLLICVFLSAIVLAQPANDNCANATSLGSLPTPGACTAGLQNGTATTLNSQTTVGATGSNPYSYLGSCEGGATDMASPALDTWYSFVATGTTVNISITNFPGVQIGLWQGACNNLTGRGCSVDGALTVNQITAGSTYYIQVSGNSATATDANFTLAVDNDIDCNNCLRAANITATPAPVNGAYQPGQTVTFCFKINQWVQQNTNWLHGVQVTLGSGWNAGTLTGNPPGSYSTLGDWEWYSPGPGNQNGTNWGTGFYYDYGAGTDPRNNLGDNNANNNIPAGEWNFCVTVTAAAACSPGSDLSISFNTSGDGESGSWSSSGCIGDYPTVYNAVGSCCPPGIVVPANVSCNGGSDGSITATPVGSNAPYTYVWTGPAAYSNTQTGVPAGANTITGLAAGTYTLNMTDASNCLQTVTVTVTQPTQIVATITPTNPSCAGTGSINVTAISGGTGPYDISIDNGSNYAFNNVAAAGNVTGLAAGTYTVFIRDANGCTRAFPVTTLTATGSVTSSFCCTCRNV